MSIRSETGVTKIGCQKQVCQKQVCQKQVSETGVRNRCIRNRYNRTIYDINRQQICEPVLKSHSYNVRLKLVTQDARDLGAEECGETEEGEVMGKSRDRRHSHREDVTAKYYNYSCI